MSASTAKKRLRPRSFIPKLKKCGHGIAGSRTTGKYEAPIFFDTALDDDVSEERKYMGKVLAF